MRHAGLPHARTQAPPNPAVLPCRIARCPPSVAAIPCCPVHALSFLQNNCLVSLDGVENAPNLATLNVSDNHLVTLDALAACPALSSLVAERNSLEAVEGLLALESCPELHTLDLQHNRVKDAAALLELLRRLPALRCLYLKGNPAVGTLPSYRKTLIAALPGLTYLDDRPVFEEERRCAEAW
jgi:dynein assembly factor 1